MEVDKVITMRLLIIKWIILWRYVHLAIQGFIVNYQENEVERIYMLETIIIIALILLVAYLIYTQQKEREKLLKMFMAKDLREVTDNEALERLPDQAPEVPPDLVSMDDATEDDKLFTRHLQAVKAAAKEELKKEIEV